MQLEVGSSIFEMRNTIRSKCVIVPLLHVEHVVHVLE